ncbi:hypothetical protein F3J13_01985 [Burkholderia sp. Tr-849]|uniref:hypothetical protein n=1 Tax=Burkholderia sp. Tr-849 TaxID=2608330 RepID=UPI00141F7A12|nr:hypothetical protein [Burkholderia sp. Tr-849]NIG01289.1 hypothetical protein [Burkholderia sp. Tr-849]
MCQPAAGTRVARGSERGDAGGARHPAAARDALPDRTVVQHVLRQRAALRQFGECAAPAWCG